MEEAEGGETMLVRSYSKSTAERYGGLTGQRPGQREEGADAAAILEQEVGTRREGREGGVGVFGLRNWRKVVLSTQRRQAEAVRSVWPGWHGLGLGC